MITTSEVAVSVTIDNDIALPGILRELELFGSVEVDKKQTIICVVGDNIAADETILQKVFQCLKDIDIRMVSYGGSVNNISLLVPADKKVSVLKQLNSGLFGL
jgi:aspartate kinase